ncbi:CHAT domain-containing protein [Fischerella thermalis]|uniref:CHAT domain-containing protein n=1 Tax=Fischerella thermalis TaxID=372787 RepID=UPI002155AFA7|nr:CHAT domain-containing protein [Fischerella thermalis]
MSNNLFGILLFVQPSQKFFAVSFHRRRCDASRWLRSILLALVTALLVIFEFNLNPAIQIAVPLTQAKSNSNQLNAQSLVAQGQKLYEAGEYTQPVKILQQAIEAFQASGDQLGQAMALGNLALVVKQLGQIQASYNYITKSLEILQANRNVETQNFASLQVLAQTLEIQGSLLLELGRTQQALDSWKQAVRIYTQLGDEVGRIRSSINLAQAEQTLGLYRQAQRNLEQLVDSVDKQPDSVIKITLLRSLGDVLQLVGELDKSTKVLQKSRDLAQKLRSPDQLAATLLSIGNIYRASGNRAREQLNTFSEARLTPLHCRTSNAQQPISQEASQAYQQAVQYYQQAATLSKSPVGQIQAKLNQLSVLLEMHNWSQARLLSADIQPRLSQIPVSQTAIFTRINLAQSLVCLKQTTNADIPEWREIAQDLATAIKQARSIGDQRSEAYALGALGALYLETKDLDNAQKLTEEAFKIAQTMQLGDIAYLWQWQLGYILRIKGDIPGAIAFYDQAYDTLQSLRNDLVALNPDIQFSFRDNVEPVYRQYVDLLLLPENRASGIVNNKQPKTNQKKLQQARKVIEALQFTELENFFREACLQPVPKQIDEVVDKTDTTAAVIYPIILKDRLEIILKLPTESELYHYTTNQQANEIEKNLDKLQQLLTQPDRINDVKKLSGKVYNWLIQPLENKLATTNVKTLVFVLDGSLRNIPMAVLYDQQDQKFLIQKYAIALAPGLQLIDPKPLQKRTFNALTAGVSKEREIEDRTFSPLTHVEDELRTIQSAIPKTEELLNQTFTRKNVQNQMQAAPYTVVHIATHGEFSSNAEKTFILTWNQLLKVKDFDKILRLGNSSKSRAIELLVLSACQTALGDKRATLGLAGIAVRAGARSTLATLWSVDDESTAVLMSKFYDELENPTLTKADALRRAQISLLESDEIPYLWAPYVLVGNWL